LTKMSTAMERYIELVKQYPGQEQVDLAVEIEVPGSLFGVGSMGSLTTTERREKYNAQAVEYSEVREFAGASRGARKTKEKAISFICLADAADKPNSDGYWMKLSQWNRYRNDTFKDRRDDELPFIPAQFSHALTTHRGSTCSRLCELIPTPTIPSRSSSLRRPSMPPSVCLSSPTHNSTCCLASSTSQSFGRGRRVSFLCTTFSGSPRWVVRRWRRQCSAARGVSA